MNPAMEALSGWPAKDVVGRHCWEVFRSRDRSGTSLCDTDCPMLKAIAGGDAVPYAEVTITARDGQERQSAAAIVGGVRQLSVWSVS